jgi:hypothetical protein
MPTQVWKPGDYRVCPRCLARHKVQDLRCSHCNAVLAGVAVRHAPAAPVADASTRTGRSLRAVLAVGVVIALASGLWVRSLFRGAAIEDSAVQAASTAAPVPAAAPSFTPPELSYPPTVGYSSGVPSNMASLTITPTPLPAESLPMPTAMAPAAPPIDSVAPQNGMTSIAPPTEPTHKTAFTNDDLGRSRPVGTVSAPAAVPVSAASSAASYGPTEGDVKKWTSRLRDREDDVREAQSKVRRIEAEAAVNRARAEATAGDPEARDKARRDAEDALEDLEKAERKLSEKQRDLDETKQEARAAGLRFEN